MQALFQSVAEDAQQAILASIAAGIIIYSRSGEIVQMNKYARDLLGYSEQEREVPCGQRRASLGLRKADGAPYEVEETPLYRALHGDTIRDEEMMLARDLRKPIWLSATLSPVGDGSEVDAAVVFVFVNITKRKLAELELKKARDEAERRAAEAERSRAILEGIMQHAPFGIAVYDQDAKLVMISETGRRMTGQSEQTLLAAPTEHRMQAVMLHPDGRPLAGSAEVPVLRVVRQGETVANEEWLLLQPDGVRVPVLYSAGPIRDPSGTVHGGVAVFFDITERKRTEVALFESEERHRVVVETFGLGYYDGDLRTGQLAWSDTAKAHFGLDPDAPVSFDTFFDGVHPADRERAREAIKAALQRRAEGTYAGLYRTVGVADGRQRWLQVAGKVFFDAQGKPIRFIASSLDVTEREEARLALQDALAREKQLALEKDASRMQLVRLLAHEIRNPMAALKGLAQLVAGKSSEESTRSLTGLMVKEVDRLAQMVTQVLDAFRVQADALTLRAQPLNLAEVVGSALDFHRLAGTHEYRAELAPEVLVAGDRARLEDVVRNLLANAEKYSPQGSRIDVELAVDEDKARLCVRDCGIGIPDGQVEQVFESFFRASNVAFGGTGGTGLGLYLCRNIVERHGGAIWAESREGAGSVFHVELPLLGGGEGAVYLDPASTASPACSE